MAIEDSVYWILHDWFFPFPLNVLWVILFGVIGYQFLQWFSSFKMHTAWHVKEGGVVLERPAHQSADGAQIIYKVSQGSTSSMQMIVSSGKLDEVKVDRVGFPLVIRKGIRERLIWLCPEGIGKTADWRVWFQKLASEVSTPRSNEQLARDAVIAWIQAAKFTLKGVLPFILMGGIGGFGAGVITLAALGLLK